MKSKKSKVIDIEEYLNDYLTQTIETLNNVLLPNGFKKSTYCLNCEHLDDYNSIDIRTSEKFKCIFDEIITCGGPTVYWFEITSGNKGREIIGALHRYKKDIGAKATPALKAGAENNESQTLYVGKVKNDFGGRLIQHLGFYKVAATQGLQLFHWAKGLSLELKIHTLVFPLAMKDILPIVEYAMAQKLNPLIGKHK